MILLQYKYILKWLQKNMAESRQKSFEWLRWIQWDTVEMSVLSSGFWMPLSLARMPSAGPLTNVVAPFEVWMLESFGITSMPSFRHVFQCLIFGWDMLHRIRKMVRNKGPLIRKAEGLENVAWFFHVFPHIFKVIFAVVIIRFFHSKP